MGWRMPFRPVAAPGRSGPFEHAAAEHVHDFRVPVIERPWADEGLPYEMISGWRCECGATSAVRGRRDRLFSPEANVRAALRYLQDRYGEVPPLWTTWKPTERTRVRVSAQGRAQRRFYIRLTSPLVAALDESGRLAEEVQWSWPS